MVLDSGKLLEMDTPAALLRKSGGYFAAMCSEYGEEMEAELKRQAEEVHFSFRCATRLSLSLHFRLIFAEEWRIRRRKGRHSSSTSTSSRRRRLFLQPAVPAQVMLRLMVGPQLLSYW